MRTRIASLNDIEDGLRFRIPEHNYVKFMSLAPKSILAPGRVVNTEIKPGRHCDIHKHSLCTCRPNITIREAVTNRTLFTLRWRGDDMLIEEAEGEE